MKLIGFNVQELQGQLQDMRAQLRNIYLNLIGLFSNPKPGIHILLAHHITPASPDINDISIFECFLARLNKKSSLIKIQEATQRILNGQIPKDEVMVAFSFDDGYEECYTIIAPLLEKYNCNAAFFINGNYVESGETYQKQYQERVNTFTKRPMNWSQIEELHKRGHVIGSHALDHFNMAELTENELHFQLSENKKLLESRLNYSCDYFAWTYGQLKHFPTKALQITQQYHPYIFSGTNYRFYFSMDGQVINRRHIEPSWSKNHIDYFLSTKKIINNH